MRQPHTGGGLRAAPFLPAVLALGLLLTGCDSLPAAREMGDMALLRTLGVDAAPAGVAVTGSTGPRAKGLQAEGEPSLVLSAERETLSGACLALQGRSDSSVFFGYVDQLLVGEALAGEDVRPVLDYFARDVELSLGAQMWLIRGSTAGEAVASGGGEGVDEQLETLRTDSRLGAAGISRTAGEVYTDLLERGSAFVPALSPAGDGSAVLAERGYAVLKEGALAGFLEGEEARGLELLAGQVSADILEEELSGGRVTVRLTGVRTSPRLSFRGDVPSALELTCKVEGRLTEYRAPLDGRELEQLQAALEARLRARMSAALERLRDWQTDCTGLGPRAAMAHPGKWQGIQADWPGWFGRVPIEVAVEVKINS